MQYRKKDFDDSREIFLEDKLLSEHCPKFKSLIEEFIGSSQKHLIINFEKAIALDTCGLGSLLFALQKISDANKSLLLKHPKNAVKDSLRMLKFDTLFKIEFAE